MENKKPTNLDEVQINDVELDEVVGGAADVLEMQELAAVREDDGCLSWNSCSSHSSN